uniref:hypothetical protein n=1 Tax=Chitinivorax sp. B TaxID=2502235 RepID=UPI0010F796ED
MPIQIQSTVVKSLSMALLSTLTLFTSLPAFATPIWCVGKLTRTYINESGELFILPDWRQDWVQ